MNALAERDLDARATRLDADVAAASGRLDPARPAVIGPTIPGDAAADYAVVEWVIEPGDELTTAPAGAAATGLTRDHPSTSDVPAELRPDDRVLAMAPDPFEAFLASGAPPTTAMTRAFALYAPLRQVIRRAVARGRCDWGAPIGEGARRRYALDAHVTMAEHLALEAHLAEDPLEAARTALVVVAYGRDVARFPALLGLETGAHIERTGLMALERVLRRPFRPGGHLEVLAALDRIAPNDVRAALEADGLGFQVWFARASGRIPAGSPPLDDQDELRMADLPLASRLLGRAHLVDREWSGYRRLCERVAVIARAPHAERVTLEATLRAEVEASDLVLAGSLLPNIDRAGLTVDTANALLAAARVLVAAHVVRDETGAWPADAGALGARLGGAPPADPFRPTGPIRFAVVGGEARAWSIGANGTDEQGATRARGVEADGGDIVLVSSAGR